MFFVATSHLTIRAVISHFLNVSYVADLHLTCQIFVFKLNTQMLLFGPFVPESYLIDKLATFASGFHIINVFIIHAKCDH
jgi:hypothetical protein